MAWEFCASLSERVATRCRSLRRQKAHSITFRARLAAVSKGCFRFRVGLLGMTGWQPRLQSHGTRNNLTHRVVQLFLGSGIPGRSLGKHRPDSLKEGHLVPNT